jgi:hypothetical protein
MGQVFCVVEGGLAGVEEDVLSDFPRCCFLLVYLHIYLFKDIL